MRSFEQLVGESVELKNVLRSPAVPGVKKREVLSRFADLLSLSSPVRNFLFVVVDRNRAAILGDVASAFEAVIDERTGLVRADIQSAVELNAEQRTSLQEQLSDVAGKQVRPAYTVDPALLGGVVARIGSTVYDGSLRTQLQQMRERLVAR